MPEISINTMIVDIQAVAAQVRELRITASRDDALPEEMNLLEEWLERANDTAARTVSTCPRTTG